MVEACRPFADVFVTPMAAVAGAVADELLAHMTAAASLDRAFVNDGGDIAVLVTPGHALDIGVAGDFSRGAVPRPQRRPAPRCRLGHRRHRHLGRARALLLARHRRCGHRAGPRRRHRRRRRHADRQRGEHRQPGRPAPPRPRPRPRQRPARPARHRLGRRAQRQPRSTPHWPAASRAPPNIRRRGLIADACLMLAGQTRALGVGRRPPVIPEFRVREISGT